MQNNTGILAVLAIFMTIGSVGTYKYLEAENAERTSPEVAEKVEAETAPGDADEKVSDSKDAADSSEVEEKTSDESTEEVAKAEQTEASSENEDAKPADEAATDEAATDEKATDEKVADAKEPGNETEEVAALGEKPADAGNVEVSSEAEVAESKDAEPAKAMTETAEAETNDAKPTGNWKMPAFDLLRVEPDGSTVIAGQGEPNTTLKVMNGEDMIAETEVASSGDFVVIFDEPLDSGDYQLSLQLEDKDGTTLTSEETAIVSVPENSDGQLLAMVSKPGEASRILNQPEVEKAEKVEVKAEEMTSETETKVAEAAASTEEKVKEVAGKVEEKTEKTVEMASNMVKEKVEEAQSEIAEATETAVATAKEAKEAVVDTAKKMLETDRATEEVAAIETQADQQDAVAAEKTVRPGAQVRIEAVEVEANKLFVAGTGTPGDRVRVFADDQEAGTSNVNSEGRFLVESEVALSVGQHMITAALEDKATNEVKLRAIVPFNRPEGAASAAVAAAKPTAETETAAKPEAKEEMAKPAAETEMAAKPEAKEEMAKPAAETEMAAKPEAKEEMAKPAADTEMAAKPETKEEMVKPAAETEMAAKPEAKEEMAKPAAETEMAARPEPKEEMVKPAAETEMAAKPEAKEEMAKPDAETEMAAKPETKEEMVKPAAEAEMAAKPEPKEEMAKPAAEAEMAAKADDEQPNTIVQEALTPANSKSVIIRRGDTLWQIARRTYGKGVRYTTIYLANQEQIQNPDRIAPGQIFAVPEEALGNSEELHRQRLKQR